MYVKSASGQGGLIPQSVPSAVSAQEKEWMETFVANNPRDSFGAKMLLGIITPNPNRRKSN